MVDKAFDVEIDLNLLDIKTEVNNCSCVAALEELRIKYLGKAGKITQLLKSMSKMSGEERSIFGAKINQLKSETFIAIKNKKNHLHEQEELVNLLQDSCDIGLPGRNIVGSGSVHPVMQTQIDLENIFAKLGFAIIAGDTSQEVETEYYNFSALNIAEHHPARAMHDTFYLRDGGLLRTHTSPVQIRTLEKIEKLPVRMVTPGKVFRCDSDQTHTPMFHQMEGLVVDDVANFSNLKWVIKTVLDEFFQLDVKLRFRPSYFPFTEPSAEVDLQWPLSGGSADQKWLEVLGCGMVHPNVLRACKVDVNKHQGYAFGFGLDRLTMLKYNIVDLRSLFSGDLNFLKQFS
jgi:phenylalanyl-tRNA synthetase alpha chain